MAGRLQHLGEAAILALLDGGESGDSDSDMVSIMSKYQKPDIKQMFLVLQVDFFCLNIGAHSNPPTHDQIPITTW